MGVGGDQLSECSPSPSRSVGASRVGRAPPPRRPQTAAASDYQDYPQVRRTADAARHGTCADTWETYCASRARACPVASQPLNPRGRPPRLSHPHLEDFAPTAPSAPTPTSPSGCPARMPSGTSPPIAGYPSRRRCRPSPTDTHPRPVREGQQASASIAEGQAIRNASQPSPSTANPLPEPERQEPPWLLTETTKVAQVERSAHDRHLRAVSALYGIRRFCWKTRSKLRFLHRMQVPQFREHFHVIMGSSNVQ